MTGVLRDLLALTFVTLTRPTISSAWNSDACPIFCSKASLSAHVHNIAHILLVFLNCALSVVAWYGFPGLQLVSYQLTLFVCMR